uniref:Uncharacterized protein n=1 Tax=Triatoma infestans TaxID=30076 RepID=A0A170U662_TRIIF
MFYEKICQKKNHLGKNRTSG